MARWARVGSDWVLNLDGTDPGARRTLPRIEVRRTDEGRWTSSCFCDGSCGPIAAFPDEREAKAAALAVALECDRRIAVPYLEVLRDALCDAA